MRSDVNWRPCCRERLGWPRKAASVDNREPLHQPVRPKIRGMNLISANKFECRTDAVQGIEACVCRCTVTSWKVKTVVLMVKLIAAA